MPANKESNRDPGASLALLWGDADSRPRRGPKPKFTPAQVARRGVEIADAEGLEALSMQRVAEMLGVTTMALYRYVPGKPDLIDLMVDTVLSDPPDLGHVPGGWRAHLEAWAHACWDVYRAHPWILTATGLRRHAMGPHQVAWLDTALAALEPTGLTARHRHDAAILVLSLVRNLTQEALDSTEEGDEEWDRLTTHQLTVHADRFPALTRAVAEGAFIPTDDDPLAFGLTCVLDGIQGLVERADRGSAHVRSSLVEDGSAAGGGELRLAMGDGDVVRRRQGAAEQSGDQDDADQGADACCGTAACCTSEERATEPTQAPAEAKAAAGCACGH